MTHISAPRLTPHPHIDIWLMPPSRLHLTVLEITHSLTAPEISTLITQLGPAIPQITDYTFQKRARVIKPLLSYDGAAVALSFLPAAGEVEEGRQGAGEGAKRQHGDEFTYHHLRRDLYSLACGAGVKVASRYVVPSCHLTVARFINERGDEEREGVGEGEDARKGDRRADMQKWVSGLEEVNDWLRREFWPRDDEGRDENEGAGMGEWMVGEDVGLDCRRGALWYGGGESVRVGKGF